MVLCDLREFGEEGERDSSELRYCERTGRRSEQCKSDCDGGKSSRDKPSSWVGCGGEWSGRGGVVEDDEESDEDVLDS